MIEGSSGPLCSPDEFDAMRADLEEAAITHIGSSDALKAKLEEACLAHGFRADVAVRDMPSWDDRPWDAKAGVVLFGSGVDILLVERLKPGWAVERMAPVWAT